MRLIDADALRETLRKQSIESFTISDEYEFFIKGLICADDAIVDAPTVEAVPVVHGKWLPKHHYIAGYEFVSGHICSECGNDALNAEGDDFLTDFCPNCGARMDAE